jgi:exodeoxyribonuclease V alpha subunit
LNMPLLDQLEISPIDEHFGRLIGRLGGGARVQEAARYVSAAREAGHTCLPLGELEGGAPAWAGDLRASPVTGAPGGWNPLILDDAGRLYLQRYWRYEQELAAGICTRLAAPATDLDEARLSTAIERLLPSSDDRTADQRRAAAAALRSRFCVITGGPGTGKTRTISVILTLLAEFSPEPPRVLLAAPTGKAAARMTEALSQTTHHTAVTLHRLLGIRPQSATPWHHAGNPLVADVVIVDEASMIDLALMAKLFAATPPSARLILLGDRDQLASVEAGHVLGDICEAAANGGARFHALQRNFRFSSESGIQKLSSAVNRGETEAALALLAAPTGNLTGRALPAPGALAAQLREMVLQAHRRTMEAPTPDDALAAQSAFRILCAIRKGPYGVDHLNRVAESILAGFIQPAGRHYPGRPIMILQNDYNLGLFNGEIGVILPNPSEPGELRAFFPDANGKVRNFHTARLPEHETAWAMTVHKSQGSECDRVLLILPDRDNPVLTRELVYTGLTRARTAAEVWYNAPVLKTAIARRTVRFSGLRDLLSQPAIASP